MWTSAEALGVVFGMKELKILDFAISYNLVIKIMFQEKWWALNHIQKQIKLHLSRYIFLVGGWTEPSIKTVK